ncbi:unnamed protein product [Notodromas monacha]|uniref:GH18 domain-containing protein n=1 Tax=Notodromas monacha TaxID=399045 RepID=A0A7R9G7X0_9CRUS|nr:unnamed protein product [Notodromas monacha]CAG0912516.1 unnamed protein product [Notodromas monacha]
MVFFPPVERLLDLINIMTYDFHGAWHPYVHHNAPMGQHPLDLTKEIAQKEGNDVFNAVSYDSATVVVLICDLAKAPGFTRHWIDELKVPYAVFQNNQWLGYDDLESIQIKVDYLNSWGLRGAMVWSVETDDFTGNCRLGNFADHKNPLLKTIAAGVFGKVPTRDPSVTIPPISSTTTTTGNPHVSTSPTARTTTNTQKLVTGNPGNICSYCPEVGDNVHPFSCTKFIKCWGTLGDWRCVETSCAQGTGFKPDTKGCVWLSELPGCNP